MRVRRDWLDTVHRAGAVPMIVWEPWERPLNGYASPTQAGASVAAIASGRYNTYIRGWARALAQYRRPVLIKFMHEMNRSWYPWSIGVNGNTAAGYVRAWRHVHDLFRAAGATNVAWVWSLNTRTGLRSAARPTAGVLLPGAPIRRLGGREQDELGHHADLEQVAQRGHDLPRRLPPPARLRPPPHDQRDRRGRARR